MCGYLGGVWRDSENVVLHHWARASIAASSVWRQPNWPVKLTYAKGRRFALAFCSGSLPLTLDQEQPTAEYKSPLAG